ncbi:MAG: hypothetical protein ACR2FG_09295 [Marmoricola sp.]
MTNFRLSFPIASAGCYDAHRAAALSGVPKSTVYDWARKEVVVPSISPRQEKLWSYADLMALRIVSWLRRPKSESSNGRLPASPMSQVREALTQLDRMNLNIWGGNSPPAHPLSWTSAATSSSTRPQASSTCVATARCRTTRDSDFWVRSRRWGSTVLT